MHICYSSSSVRSSKCIQAQPTDDDTQMGRAMTLADQRNSIQGNTKSMHSILAFSDKQIADRASKLGVSLWENDKEIFNSAMLIKKSLIERSICILDNKFKNNEDVQPFSLILNRASALTEDLVDEENDRRMEDQSDFPVLSDTVKRTRKRRVYFGTSKRRSARIKIQNKCNNA